MFEQIIKILALTGIIVLDHAVFKINNEYYESLITKI